MISSNEHVHHWLIEEPNEQRISRGVCACGAVREFENMPDCRRAYSKPPMLAGSTPRQFPKAKKAKATHRRGWPKYYPGIIEMIRKGK